MIFAVDTDGIWMIFARMIFAVDTDDIWMIFARMLFAVMIFAVDICSRM